MNRTSLLLTVGILAACAGTGGPTAKLPALGPLPPGVRATVHVDEYPVTAATIAELRREFRRAGPMSAGRRYAGVTQWRVRWTYEFVRNGTGCALRNLRAHVEARVELPRWDAAAASDSATVAWWEDFRERLIAHEHGHVRIAVDAGRAIVEALRPLSGGACDALGVMANDRGRLLLTEARRRQAEYDRDTRHGALPGSPIVRGRSNMPE